MYKIDHSKMLKFSSGELIESTIYPEVEHVGISCGLPYDTYPDKWQLTQNFQLKNLTIKSGHMWGSRCHGVGSGHIYGCKTTNIDREHAWYWNIASGASTPIILFEKCAVQNVGGQAWQFAARESETNPENWGELPAIVLKECYADNTALRPDHRGSFAYSFHKPNGPRGENGQFTESTNFYGKIFLDRCFLDNRMQETSRGMLMARGYDSINIRSSWFASNSFEKKGYYGGQTAVILEGTRGNSRGAKSRLVIKKSYFDEIGGHTGYGRMQILNWDEVVIEDCLGNLEVNIEGKTLGRLSEVAGTFTF